MLTASRQSILNPQLQSACSGQSARIDPHGLRRIRIPLRTLLRTIIEPVNHTMLLGVRLHSDISTNLRRRTGDRSIGWIHNLRLRRLLVPSGLLRIAILALHTQCIHSTHLEHQVFLTAAAIQDLSRKDVGCRFGGDNIRPGLHRLASISDLVMIHAIRFIYCPCPGNGQAGLEDLVKGGNHRL